MNPPTELIDGSGLPVERHQRDADLVKADDGTQIWKITHNGVDTHPIHFHLYDVQVLNRVTWDNIIIPPDPNELGLEGHGPGQPARGHDRRRCGRSSRRCRSRCPNSIRLLNPMMPRSGDTVRGFNNVDPNGNPTTPITNKLVNFGWEYVYHCHILSHEEMDMMRPVSLALPPIKSGNLAYTVAGNGNNRHLTLTWDDNSITETSFVVQKTIDGTTWTNVGTINSPLNQPNIHQPRSLTDPGKYDPNVAVLYRVVAENTVGYGAEFPSMTVKSVSDPLAIGTAPAAPTALTATLQSVLRVNLTWTDNAVNEVGFVIQRSTNGGPFTQIATAPARAGTGSVTYIDTTVAPGTTYTYQVAATNAIAVSNFATATVVVPALPAAPTILTAKSAASGNGERMTVTWASVPGATGYTIQWSATAAFTTIAGSGTVGSTATTFTTGQLPRQTYYVRAIANNNLVGPSQPSGVWTVPYNAPAVPPLAAVTRRQHGRRDLARRARVAPASRSRSPCPPGPRCCKWGS